MSIRLFFINILFIEILCTYLSAIALLYIVRFLKIVILVGENFEKEKKC